MAGQIEAYRQEIFNFLRTVSIKFEPFAYLMGQSYMDQYGLTDPHQEWNPYYINLSGEYSESDTRMTVYSLEEERHVPFDKDLVRNYPKTATLYRIPNAEYFTLEERYPENVGLIRSIAYPVTDIQTAIQAPNFSLLAYDDSLLHLNEREVLVKTLKNFLTMVKTRWWVPEFGYEDMYALTFWGMLWQHLPNLLLAQRFKNIRTPYVHPFHIWEYLKSKGLGDYRDVLTNNQALWLYRNINYIQKNKGKNSNLVILAENLLGEIFVSLLYKDMYQETATKWDEPRTNPEFRSFNIVTGEEVKVESFKTLNDRLYEIGLENRNSADFVAQTEAELGTHNFNILPTKFLEFKKEPINTSNERLMVNFFLDTLMYRFKENDCSFNCIVMDPLNNTKITLYVGDMIALWYWCLMRSVGESPVNLPNKYRSHIAFIKEQPELSDLRMSVFYNKVEYPIKTLINVNKMITMITWDKKPFVKQSSFMTSLVNQFRALLTFQQNMEQSNKFLYHKAMMSFFGDTMVSEWFPITLSNKTSYADWIASNEFIADLVDAYEKQSDVPNTYLKLAERCFDSLFPLDEATSSEFIGSVRNLERVYTSVRDLFIHLGSYNITYLETERDQHQYLKIPEPDFIQPIVSLNYDGFWNLVIDNLLFRGKINQNINIRDIQIEFGMTQHEIEMRTDDIRYIDFDIERTDRWSHKRFVQFDIPITEKQTTNRTDRRINTDMTSVRPKG